jgi:hypothetical protein
MPPLSAAGANKDREGERLANFTCLARCFIATLSRCPRSHHEISTKNTRYASQRCHNKTKIPARRIDRKTTTNIEGVNSVPSGRLFPQSSATPQLYALVVMQTKVTGLAKKSGPAVRRTGIAGIASFTQIIKYSESSCVRCRTVLCFEPSRRQA